MVTLSGGVPVLLALALMALAATEICRNPDKRTAGYQWGVAAAFCALVLASCGVLMLGTGLGWGLFSGGRGAMYAGGS